MKLGDLVGRITRHGVKYSAGELLGRMAGFLLIPLYTAVLVPEAFGRLQVLLSLHQMGQFTADLGLSAAFLRWYGLAKEGEERRRILANIALGTLAASAGCTVLFLAAAKPLSMVLLTAADYAPLVQLVGISVGLRVVSTVGLTYLRLQERSGAYAAFSLGRTLLSLSLVLYFVLARRQGVYGILLGETLANVAAVAVAAALLAPGFRWKVSWSDLKGYLGYSLPFVVTNMGAFALFATDKFLLSAMKYAEETGLYSLGGKLGIALNVAIIWPFTLVWHPILFRIARDETVEETRRLLARVFTYMTGILVWAGLSLALFGPELIDVMSPPAYAAANQVVPFLVVSYVIYGCYRHFQAGLYITGKSRIVATSFLAAAAVNLLLNLAWIPLWGMRGAAVATLVSFAVMAAMVLIAAQREYPIPYEWGRVARLVVWGLALYGAGVWLLRNPGLAWPHSALKLPILAAYPAGVLMLRILTPGERREASRIFARGRGGRRPEGWQREEP